MKYMLLCAAVAALALLAWSSWLLTTGEPTATGSESGHDSPAPVAAALVGSQQVAAEAERLRRSVDGPTGPGTARVTCVWANDGEFAVAMPVRAYRIEGRARVGPVATATTDVAGVVTFHELVASEHSFCVGRTEARATIAPGVLVETELRIRGFAVVRGTVVDDAKEPIALAEIVAELDGGPCVLATTDPGGRFRVRLASRAKLWAQKIGYQPSSCFSVAIDTDEIVLRMGVGVGSIKGSVLDPNGNVVPRASIAIAIDANASSEHSRQPPVLLEADDHGQFATAQVPRGTLTVYGHADGFAFGQCDVDTTSNERIVVQLRRGASIHGILLGGEHGGEPQVGVRLVVLGQRKLPGLMGTSHRFTHRGTTTDASGRYRMTAIASGRMSIHAWVLPMSVTHRINLREGENYQWSPDLSRPSQVIRGFLRGPDGEPLSGWHVKASRIDPVEMSPELASATTGAEGGFELRELSANPQTLTVRPPDSIEVVAERTDVQPGQPSFVWRLAGLPSQSGTITGRLLDSEGQSVADAKLSASSDGVWRRTSQHGNSEHGFRIDRVLPGAWQVVGQLQGYGSFDLGRHWVTANAVVDIGLHRLPSPGAAVVQVNGQGFEPAGIHLALEQLQGGNNKSSEFLAKDGALRSPLLPPGRYRLLARGENFPPIARDVTITPGADVTVDLNVAAAAPVAIEFVPEDLAGQELQGYLQFELRDASGGVLVTGRRGLGGASSATLRIGLAAGAYTIEAWSYSGAYRRGRSALLVPSGANGKLDVSVLLEVQKR